MNKEEIIKELKAWLTELEPPGYEGYYSSKSEDDYYDGYYSAKGADYDHLEELLDRIEKDE